MEYNIKSYKELRELIEYEKKGYYPKKPYNGLYIIDKIVKESYQQIWKYQKLLRKTEYVYSKRKNIFYLFLYCIIGRKKNKVGAQLGIYIPEYVFGKGLIIDHYGSITVNGRCKIGNNCRLHGNNCIGNKGDGREKEFPIIGDNFDLGFGATVIGDVKLGDNIKVGSNAVVTKNFSDNLILAGVPARKI